MAALRKTWISSAHRGCTVGKMHENTLSAFLLAAQKGADMIETDVRATADGVLVACHNPAAQGWEEDGRPVSCEIAAVDFKTLSRLLLAPGDPAGAQRVPTLEQVLNLAYYTGLQVNLDLKEGLPHAAETARLVCACGLRGRVVYATNGAGEQVIPAVLPIDPDARFIDRLPNFSREKLAFFKAYPARCYAYTGDFSEENIARIRACGCLLAAIGLNAQNAAAAFRHHPDMAEYPHTSDFEAIDRGILAGAKLL